MTRPSRRGILQGGAVAALWAALPSRLARAATDRRFVIYWAGGGWDPTFVFDPHFDSDLVEGDPGAEPGLVGGLSFADSEERPSVRAFFERHASRCCIVNGLAVGSISHTRCTRNLLTGSRDLEAPDLATILGFELGNHRALPTALLSGPRFPGRLGAGSIEVSQVLTGTASGSLPAGSSYDPEREARLRRYLGDEGRAREQRQPAMSGWLEGLDRFDELETGAGGIEMPERPLFADQLNTGLAALASDLAQVIVVAGSVPNLSQWDSHNNNDQLQSQNFEMAFSELGQLLEGLEATAATGGGSLASTTTVLVMSEMGRTPVHNGAGGKDHWPYTSLMAIGAGVQGGVVLGSSDDTLVGETIDLSTGAASAAGELLGPAAIGAGLLQSLGLDPEPYYGSETPFTAMWTS